MQKQITKFEVKRGERNYLFFMENDTPLGELHDVLLEMRQYVIDTVNKVMEQQKAQSESPKIIEGDFPKTDEVNPDAGQ